MNLAAVLLTTSLTLSAVRPDLPIIHAPDQNRPASGWDAPGLPRVFFCGEAVPLHEEMVARRLVAVLARHADRGEVLGQLRQRAESFFPIIEPILAKHHIPKDFKYLPLVESALHGRAVSAKGAVGYWQLMPATARELGLHVTPRYDERTDLRKSTEAACRYLRFLHNRFGSWTLAAAAYNIGIGSLLSNIRRQQQRDYYYLRLNAETGQYLYRILAFKELFTNDRTYRDFLPRQTMARLEQPVNANAADAAAEDVLLSETLLDTETRAIADAPAPIETETETDAVRPANVVLPNAAAVFAGGIKATLREAGKLTRGQTWVFDLTRDGLANAETAAEGDRIYAVVEDIDLKTNRIYFRAETLFSRTEQQTYQLALAAVDAKTGRVGLSLADLAEGKPGLVLTWKVL
jgi:membrane-bound lytic murein transglycosylase D